MRCNRAWPRVVLAGAMAASGGCGPAMAPATSAPRTEPTPAALPPAVEPPGGVPSATSASPVTAGPRPCGALGCLTFPTAVAAFSHVVQDAPRVLAVGEAHSLKGTEAIQSTVSRFSRNLLPVLRGRATDLVLELMIPEGPCEQAHAEVRDQQRVVTEKQSEQNQSEYVELGHRARAAGIVPYPLRPTCAELAQIAEAGDDAVLEMLRTIAVLTIETVSSRLGQLQDRPEAMVVAYGGALHNDRFPRAGREEFSFGPALFELTAGRYTEVDLIVPEFIRDTESWRAFEWYDVFDPTAHPERATLFNPRPGAFVLIFPAANSGASRVTE